MPRLSSGNPLDKFNNADEIITPMQWMACPTCAVQYAIPVILEQMRADDGEPYYCPNGHEILIEERENATDLAEERDRLKQENIQLRHSLDQTQAKLRDQRTASTESKHADDPDTTIKPNTQVTEDAVLPCPYCDRKLKNRRGLTHRRRSAHRDELGGGT